MQAIERDKLYHFVMASEQINPVLIIRSPTETTAIKQFLGYEWSAAKGDEGIKLLKDSQGRHLTSLYDETDRDNENKLNQLVAANFDGKPTTIPSMLESFARSVTLVDMMDFSRSDFDKKITIVSKSSFSLSSKHPLKRIDTIAKIINGGTPDTKKREFWDGGKICWATLADTKEKYLTNTQRKITDLGLKHTNLLPVNAVIFSSRATIGQISIAKVETSTNQGFKSFICYSDLIDYEYLYYILQHLRPVFESLIPSGSKYKEINSSTIQSFLIPVPADISTQRAIAKKCIDIDASAPDILRSGVSLRDLPGVIAKKKRTVFDAVVTIGKQ